MNKLKILMESEGYTDQVEMAEDFIHEGMVPAICMNDDCEAIYYHEPDSREGYCDICETNSVESCLSLMGLI